jgi:hypothetical protein
MTYAKKIETFHDQTVRKPLDRRLGRPQSQSGHSGKVKNFQPLPGLKPLISQPIAQCYATDLSQLLSKV